MANAKINNLPLWDASDEAVALEGKLYNCTVLVNKVSNERIISRRPCLETYIDLGTAMPVDGLYWWDNKQIALAVSDGRLFKISDIFGTVTELTVSGSGSMVAGVRPIFATDGENVLIATGGQMVRTDGDGASYLTSVDAPAASHCIWKDTYYIANYPTSDQFGWSNVGNEIDVWDAIDTSVAMVGPDPLVALATDGREVYMFGTSTIETFYNDGVTPWARYDAGVVNAGCIAPHTICRAKGAWIFLNERREICTIAGRGTESLSDAFAKSLQSFTNINNAIADTFDLNGQTYYVVTFPTHDKTFVINLTAGEWQGEWTRWNNGFHERWLGNCITTASIWDQVLVGSRVDGQVYLLSGSATTDASTTVRGLYRSPFIDHGTFNSKRSGRLRIKLKRGVGDGDLTEPQFILRHRDNGAGAWSDDLFLSAGVAGDVSSYIDAFNLGLYNQRQYEIEFTADTTMLIAGMEEQVQVLDR